MLPKTPILLRSIISGQLLLLLILVVVSSTSVPKSNDEKNLQAEAIVDESYELSDEALGSIIKDFGQEIGETMKDEVNKLLDDVEDDKKGPVNEAELEKFKEANEALSQDSQARIEMAGRQNKGEMTRSIVGDKAQSFLTQVSGRLQSAGAYIGQQMGTLASMAPKIKGKLRAIPGKLRKLMQWPTFLRYKIKFNKVYKSLREELYRQLVYLRTQTKVGVQNLKYLVGKTTHLLKATQFADITQNEYRAIINNPLAESEVDQLKSDRMDSGTLERMKTLAKENRNIFGQDMDELAKRRKEEGSRRRRRSIQFVNNNELDDDEEMEDSFDDIQADGHSNDEEDAMMMDTDEFKVVDEYAAEFEADADLNSIDELDDLLDDALESDKAQFKGIDLRETKCVPRPENQDRCGACYAYVITAAATYFNCIARPEDKRRPERLNSRFLSDCGRYQAQDGELLYINGCKGGKLTHAFQFTAQAGGYPFMRYEYARVSFNQYKTDTCVYPRPETIEDWAPIPVPFFKNTRIIYLEDFDQAKLHLHTVGPVFVNLRTWDNFENMGSGIYNGTAESENPIIHSMWIVGYDKDKNGHDYWIVWNSHGIAWGEYGFMRIYTPSLSFYMVYLGGLMTTEAIKTIG